jgi:hypothetical protein
MEAIWFSETLCKSKGSWPYNPKNYTLHNHHHENLRVNMKIKYFLDRTEEIFGISVI